MSTWQLDQHQRENKLVYLHHEILHGNLFLKITHTTIWINHTNNLSSEKMTQEIIQPRQDDGKNTVWEKGWRTGEG